MKISFVKTVDASLASMRYRILLPMNGLRDLGHEVEIVDTLPDKTDALIFSKHFNQPRDYKMAIAAKEAGIKVIFDVCDNHYNNQNASYYQDMTRLADIVTCNTPIMRETILSQAAAMAVIVDDPYEMARKEPIFRFDGDRIKVLWYGHSSNLNTLPALLRGLSQISRKSHLLVVSNARFGVKKEIEKIKIENAPWSMEVMDKHLKWADIVAIPTILSDETKRTKSHNRVTEAIMSGKMVVAHPLPSYERYKPYVWIGEDLADGFDWVMRDPERNMELIKKGQDFIESTLSSEKIGQAWEDAIGGR